jgi:hypothetical protein
MDQTELKQNIAKYYSKLPGGLQQFFSDMNWIKTLEEISIKYGLNDEQTKSLSTETTLVLLCVLPIEEYIKNLESEIKISKEKYDQLLSDLNEKIFKDIGYEIEESFEKNLNSLTEEENNKKEPEVKTETDDTPIPPYKKLIKNEGAENIINNKIISKPEPLKTPEQAKAPEGIVVEAPTQKEVVVEILKTVAPIKTQVENKPAMVVHNIFEEKLKTPTISHSSVSDHSVPQISQVATKIINNSTNPTAKTVDPYREVF